MKETAGMKLARETAEPKEFTFHVSAIAKTRVSAEVTVPAEDLETARSIVTNMLHTFDFDWSDDYEPYDVMEETIEIEPWEEND